ncbi:DUF4255 domain-containing protein [Aliifodinibius sp. S!AR15-10]|uniref:DUF4255 domain-containing protein n=1 Tax=Aliifodinibius sp. S!AR15-10 TaxID=2950437 RepID=UPI0028543CDA|nr:DUF4255 domain-containing protein [Aliifodinibius sp. S!AR15-10]MDR8390622.1 DUF4255 domain-containing protein [Aliifodinibius sp. S!AR15-10]
MIHSALSFITQELNEYLKLKTDTPDVNRVFLTSVATESDGVVIPEGSLGLSLINIEEERVFKDQKTTFINEDGIAERMNPELKLNLYILISANFQDTSQQDPSDDYVEGLKQLSYVISFFQSKFVFTPDNSPALSGFDPQLKKLIVELYSYSFEQLYNFWTVVGTKYLPSVLYRIRLVRFQERDLKDQNLPIEKIGITSHGT